MMQMYKALTDARNVIALGLNNGLWGEESSDDMDSRDEVLSVLAYIDDALEAWEKGDPED